MGGADRDPPGAVLIIRVLLWVVRRMKASFISVKCLVTSIAR